MATANNGAQALAHIQRKAAQARDLELEIKSLEEQLKAKREALNKILASELPDMFNEAGTDHIGIPKQGNLPARDFALKPYYSANIAASWDEERRARAFDFLKSKKAEDLIKTEVVARLPKGKLKEAKSLVAAAKKLKVAATLKMSVHSATLTAWLKEWYDNGKSFSAADLEKIGGSIGQYVKMEDRSD